MSGAEAAIAAARTQLGVPYSWGGGGVKGPSRGIEQGAGTVGFDCSSLVQYSYAQAGINLPRTSQAQQKSTQRIDAKDARPGDLVFYGGPAHHVGLYLGGGQMIAAPKTGDRVKIQPVYTAGDGPTYGRVPYSGAGASKGATAAVDKATSAVADAAGGAVAALGVDAVKAAQPVLIKVGVVVLGLALVGVGVVRTAGGSK